MESKRLGEMVREARERKGLRGFELAAAIGKQPSLISRIETGAIKETPPPDVLTALRDHLGLDETEMLAALGYFQGEPGTAPEAEPDEWKRRLHAAVDRVNWTKAPKMAATLLEIMAAQLYDQTEHAAAPSERSPANLGQGR